MSRIETEGLTKYYESLVAVDHLTFKVKEGEVFGLLGPNVAGKTTTIRAQKLNQQ
jgi:ABC-2 type transport system ATP-binding protein